jgi:hypothetical protein
MLRMPILLVQALCLLAPAVIYVCDRTVSDQVYNAADSLYLIILVVRYALASN